MAEIKSTLELAMEKTKKIEISEKEKEEIKQKEIVQKVKALFHRYRDGYLPLNEIQKEIQRMDEETAKVVREGLVSQWIDSLSMNEEDERFLMGIESLQHWNLKETKGDFHRLLSQYQKEKDGLRERLRSQAIEAWRRDGIEGSAIDPHIEASEDWKNELVTLDQKVNLRLEEIKERLRAL